MIKNNYGRGRWTFPGGKIEKGEAAEDAIRREIFKEVGITIKNILTLGEFKSNREYKKDTVTVFAAESNNKDFKIDPTEISEAKWFSEGNLPQLSEYTVKVLSLWRREEI